MYTFKDFLGGKGIQEDGPVGTVAPSAGAPAGGQAAGANSALAAQSQNLQKQLGDMNTRLQRLMQQKAQIDKQIQTASSQSANQAQSTQATQAAATVGPGAAPAVGTN